jgi:prevent-host-death family protein
MSSPLAASPICTSYSARIGPRTTRIERGLLLHRRCRRPRSPFSVMDRLAGTVGSDGFRGSRLTPTPAKCAISSTMRAIGIRELRQQASKYLRDVEAGETIEVTDRGRPVALIVPLPRTGRLQRLATAGRLDEARGDALELGDPLEPATGAPLPSETLAALRANER